MSFLYPRTIKVTRPPAQTTGAGFQGNAPASERGKETCTVESVRASIQLRGRQGSNPTGLPADTPQQEWEILIGRRFCSRGTILEGDIVTDDLAERYQVTADYWNSLGYALRAVKLKA